LLSLLVVSMLFMLYNLQQNRAQAENIGYAVSARGADYLLLSRLISGEAGGEPYIGQVGVGAVILNRVKSPKFPGTVAGVIYQPGAFESVRNGQLWVQYPSRANFNAARDSINGWDPTYGSLFFWNPYKKVHPWIWTRRIITQLGNHVFGK